MPITRVGNYYSVTLRKTFLGLYAYRNKASRVLEFMKNKYPGLKGEALQDAFLNHVKELNVHPPVRPRSQEHQKLFQDSTGLVIPSGVRFAKAGWTVSFRNKYLAFYTDFEDAKRVRLWMERFDPKDAAAMFKEAVEAGLLPRPVRSKLLDK